LQRVFQNSRIPGQIAGHAADQFDAHEVSPGLMVRSHALRLIEVAQLRARRRVPVDGSKSFSLGKMHIALSRYPGSGRTMSLPDNRYTGWLIQINAEFD
jgi:hypothetical protein